MQSLRIVLVMIEPPLPFGSAAARWYFVLLRGLVERGHRVTALAACSKEEQIPQVQQLFPAPRYDLRCFAFPHRRGLFAKIQTLGRPYSYMFGPEFLRDLRRELDHGFDILHLESLWSGWAALDRRDRTLVNVQYLCEIDTEAISPSTWRGWLERRLMLATERRLLRYFRRFRVLSDRMADRISRQNPSALTTVVPLGLEPKLYPYIPDAVRTREPVVSIIGTMNWYPSHSAAVRLLVRLWPEIHRQIPTARLQIVGWSARTTLREFVNIPGVTIEENVPDIRPYFERTGVLLYAPSRGSGMKVKVLEALAFGVPVVTTSEGVEGIPAADGLHAGVSEDDAGLIERTVRLLNDPAAQNRQRAAGRALLEAHCGPKPTLDGIEAIYAKMLAAICK